MPENHSGSFVPDRPLPEGARFGKSGRVWRGTTEFVPCPTCTAGWKTYRAKACHSCKPQAACAAAARQKRAGKPRVGFRPRPAPPSPASPADRLARPSAVTLAPPHMPIPETPAQKAICQACATMAVILIAKNRAYGNSVFEPVSVFAKGDPEQLLNVRIDDKLSRLMRGEDAGEDPELDLTGYLLLKRAWRLLRAGQEAAP